MILIFVSFETIEDAEKAANYLVDSHLAACVELLPVTNFYYWNNKKVKASEISGIIKTDDGYFEKIKTELEKILPYEIPQIIEVKTTNVNENYLKWLKEFVR